MLCKAYGYKRQQHKYKAIGKQRVVAQLVKENAHKERRYGLRRHGHGVVEARIFANVAAAAYFPNHRERVHGHRCLRKANHGEHYIKIKAELTRAERCHGEARRRCKQAYAYHVAAAYLCAYHADGYIRCDGSNGCNHKAGGCVAEPAGPCGGGIACEERSYGIVAQEPKADGGKYQQQAL